MIRIYPDVPDISPTMMLKGNGDRDSVDIVPYPNLFTDQWIDVRAVCFSKDSYLIL